MEPYQEPIPSADARPPAELGELILQNGKKGASRALSAPVTAIGRSPQCDLRLGTPDHLPLHCLLVASASGWQIRNFAAPEEVKVNGVATAQGPVVDGDLLEIGRYRFLLRIHRPPPAQEIVETRARLEREKQALRVQAAAVAAQQADLMEQEAQLVERRAALQQQEEQLSGHLEEKRRKLVTLREQTQEAVRALREEKASHTARLRDDERERAAAWREVTDGRETVASERKHLQRLRVRLKKRWHRAWMAERNTLTQKEAALVRQTQALEAARLTLHDEKAALLAARLRFNGEAELGRRQLEDARATFRREKAQDEDRLDRAEQEARARNKQLETRETALAEGERDLNERQQHWQRWRAQLEREIEGLENRARNCRRNLFDLEQAVATNKSVATVPASEMIAEVKPLALAGPVSALPQPLPESLPLRLDQVERLAEELADQRLQLVEQGQRLVRVELAWRHEREEVAAALEQIGRQLHERESAVVERERALDALEMRLRHRQGEISQIQRQYEGWQARMTGREAAWHAERDRLLADLRTRERLAEQRLAAVSQVAARWGRRRQGERDRLTAERAASEKLRRELTTLRDDWLRRVGEVQEAQRRVARQALALEQYRQEYLTRAEDPPTASRRLEKLRARWNAQSTAARKALAEQRKALALEAQRLGEFHTQVERQTTDLNARDIEIAEQERAWDRDQLLHQDEVLRLRAELARQMAHRERCERQLADYAEEIERLAQYLLGETDPPALLTLAA